MSASHEMLSTLFERGSGTYIELRCINRVTGKVNQQYFEPDDLTTLEEVAQAYCDAIDVYFGVVMRTRRSGGKDAVAGVQALWADVDTPEATLELTMFELPPSIVVASGSPAGYHAYWLLDKPLGVSEAEELLRLLAHRLGSDLARSLTRVGYSASPTRSTTSPHHPPLSSSASWKATSMQARTFELP